MNSGDKLFWGQRARAAITAQLKRRFIVAKTLPEIGLSVDNYYGFFPCHQIEKLMVRVGSAPRGINPSSNGSESSALF